MFDKEFITKNPYPPARGNWRKLSSTEKRVTLSGLPIAPAFTDVYINLDKKAPMEAVGKDSKDRVKYIYTKKYTSRTGAGKYKRVEKWQEAYPGIISRIEKQFSKKEEAKLLYLIDKTKFRVGGEGDTKAEVIAYGATTLKPEHIKIDKDIITFNFIGKKGVHQIKEIKDPLLAKLLRGRVKNKDKLFNTNEYRVLQYLRSLPRASKFKVSDFRPYYATKVARQMVDSTSIPVTKKEFKQKQKEIAMVVSEELGNTPSVALSSYIDPRVWLLWEAKLPVVVKRVKKIKRRIK